MKRLYETSLGSLELDLDAEAAELSIWLFDAEGRVALESGDEWEQAEVFDLLHSEVGLPEPEARSIATSFLETAKSRGFQQPASSELGGAVVLLFVAAVLALLGIGLWTVVRWIF